MEGSAPSICILGDGLLGTEIHAQTGWPIISRKRHGFDITNQETWSDRLLVKDHGSILYPKYTTIINCIACTDTYSTNKTVHWAVNYKGVVDLTDFCLQYNIKLVHISTDYIYSNSKPNANEDLDIPVHCGNWYGYTKLLGDAYVQLKSQANLVIRSTHKPRPFPYKKAWAFQCGNFDYVDIITELIVWLIDHKCCGVYNVGTNAKTMFDLARRTVPNVEPEWNAYLETTPTNVTMDLTKMMKVS